MIPPSYKPSVFRATPEKLCVSMVASGTRKGHHTTHPDEPDAQATSKSISFYRFTRENNARVNQLRVPSGFTKGVLSGTRNRSIHAVSS